MHERLQSRYVPSILYMDLSKCMQMLSIPYRIPAHGTRTQRPHSHPEHSLSFVPVSEELRAPQ
eukprot:1158406-Pelagomonas_calceolata.AAC.4